MFVLEARSARTSLISTDLGAGLPGTSHRLRRHLDPLLPDLELRFLMPESYSPSLKAFFCRRDIVLTGGNLPLAGGKLFSGLLRHKGNPVAVALAERAHQLALDRGLPRRRSERRSDRQEPGTGG